MTTRTLQNEVSGPNSTDICPEIKVYGMVIRRALIDYALGDWRVKKLSKLNVLHYYSAKMFLFSERGLESRIYDIGLPLEISYIRKKALLMAEKYKGKRTIEKETGCVARLSKERIEHL